MILKRFTDEQDWLHLYSRREGRLRRTRIENAFCKNHLYSEIRNDGQKDFRVESELAWLESAMEPILKKFEQSVVSGQLPKLHALEVRTWHLFLVIQWRRVPDLHISVATDEESADYLNEILDDFLTQFPDKADEIEAMREPRAVARTVRNARVSNVPQASARVMDALATRGIAILAITAPNKSLIVGSRPVVQLAFREGLNLMDEVTEMWLPISSTLAIGLGKSTESETMYALSDHAAIRRLNLAIARQSTEFASRSPTLTSSIANAA